MNSYEVEIKSLLGAKEKADKLKKKLQDIDSDTKCVSKHKQLNHYFIDGDVLNLFTLLKDKLPKTEQDKLKNIVEDGNDFSIRTRLADRKLLFVLKASLDEGTSHNTVSRLEFEVEIKDMTLDELDSLILKAGYVYQAKWSREREEYVCKDITVCLDKNAGYGYLAEFEKVVNDVEKLPLIRDELRSFMKELEVEELPQDRLERMFSHYNKNWPLYYGTDKIFIVE